MDIEGYEIQETKHEAYILESCVFSCSLSSLMIPCSLSSLVKDLFTSHVLGALPPSTVLDCILCEAVFYPFHPLNMIILILLILEVPSEALTQAASPAESGCDII